MSLKRGMLIVFEGNDRVGKTTQARKLVQWLNTQQKPTDFIAFPDRSTSIGTVINQYLLGKTKLHDNAIHLLFTANRWEKYDEIMSTLKSGKNLVVDRYSYSGVAYSASKPGSQFDWCKNPESGLPKPDCVIFLSSDIKMLENRENFGNEIYETSDFQNSVRNSYMKMKEKNWNVIDANRTVDEVHEEIVEVVNNKLINLSEDISKLW